MQNKEFWEECVALGVVVVPFMAHNGYDPAGNHDAETQIGLRFICMEFDPSANLVPGEFWLELETGSTNLTLVAESPELALEAFKRFARERATNPLWMGSKPGNP